MDIPPKRNRAVVFYHTVVAILILLGGGALLGLGIWLRTTDNGGPLNLQYGSDDSVVRGLLHFSTGALVLGGFLLVTGVIALLAMARQCVGVTFRVIYVLLALIIAGALGFSCFVAASITSNVEHSEVRDFVRDAWLATVREAPGEVCRIEEHFKCRGFADNDCRECPTGNESACNTKPFCARCGDASTALVGEGCYDKIAENARRVFRPVAIIAGIVGAIVLIDALVSCCL